MAKREIKTKIISAPVTLSLHKALEARAQAEDVPMSHIIREALKAYLTTHQQTHNTHTQHPLLTASWFSPVNLVVNERGYLIDAYWGDGGDENLHIIFENMYADDSGEISIPQSLHSFILKNLEIDVDLYQLFSDPKTAGSVIKPLIEKWQRQSNTNANDNGNKT